MVTISRARAMQKSLQKRILPKSIGTGSLIKTKYFCMQDFKNSDYRKGLTFHVENGKVNYFRLLELNYDQKILKALLCYNYDLILPILNNYY